MLKLDTKAPDFSLPDQDGKLRSLSDQKGLWTVVYFYPKDDTAGCTKEACAIRDVYNDFAQLGVAVWGVSKDSSRSHKRFQEKYELPFTLLSDESTKMIEAYGAWQEKSMYGKKYMGTERMSYLINPGGMVVKVYPDVDPANHALEILRDLRTFV